MTNQLLYHGDARDLSYIPDRSVHLVLTSPPYFNLKEYRCGKNQLGMLNTYQDFINELEKVWQECYRVLVPGGRIVCVVGDVCLSRRKYGRHVVMPLHSDIAVSCRKIGFDNLNPILWHKISNATFEANTSSSILGKPYEPNAIIKNDVEYILMERKPGGYRKPTEQQDMGNARSLHKEWSPGPLPPGACQPSGKNVFLHGRHCVGPLLRKRHNYAGLCWQWSEQYQCGNRGLLL